MLPQAKRLALLLSLCLGAASLSSCGNSEAHALDKPGGGGFSEPQGDTGPGSGLTFPDGITGTWTAEFDVEPLTTKPTPARQHPYLLFDSTDAKLLDEISNPKTERYRIFQALRRAVDENGSSCPYTALSAYGICYALTGDTGYAKSVHTRLRTLADESEWEGGVRDRTMAVKLTQFALAFDLCYDYLRSKSDFRKLRDKLARETFKMHQAATGGYRSEWENWWGHAYCQNHFHRNVAGFTFGALALKFEGNDLSDFTQPDVNRWITSARDEWTKNHAAISGIVDGSWFEGTGYEETALGVDMPDPLFVLRRVEGLDLLTTSPLLRMLPVFWIYNSNPESARWRLTQFGDNGAGWSRKNGLLSTLRLCARVFSDPYAQWAADRLARDGQRDLSFKGNPLYVASIATELVYYDSSVQARSPSGDWADSWHAQSLEMAFLRTGWDKGQLHAALKCGAYGGRAFFELARDNYRFVDGKWKNRGYPVGGSEGTYPQDFYFTTAHAHPDNNGFYILGGGVYLAPERPGNKGASRFTSSHNTITVDGRGQVGEEHVHPTHGKDRGDFFRSDGSIAAFAPSRRFDFTVGDATRCYPRKLGLKEFRRHFFFLKPDYFVVFDTLDADSEKTYGWNCHFTNGATFDGRWVKGKADNGRVLGVHVVSPGSYTRQVESLGESDDFKYVSAGKRLYATRLTMKGAGKRRFITLLYPTTGASWEERPAVEKISETSAAAGIRVRHRGGAEDAILCNYHGDGTTAIGEYKTDARGAVVRRDSQDEMSALFLAGGTTLSLDGEPLVRLPSPARSFEAFFDGATVEVTGRGIPGFELLAPHVSLVTVNGENVGFRREGDWIHVTP